MNIFQKVTALFKVLKILQEVKMLKGLRTTEFWISLGGIVYAVWTAAQGMIDPALSVQIVGIVVAVYALARAISKITPWKGDDEFLDKLAAKIKGQ